MKIRDEFALMAAEVMLEKNDLQRIDAALMKAIAKSAYIFADAMVEAGKVKEKQVPTPDEPLTNEPTSSMYKEHQ